MITPFMDINPSDIKNSQQMIIWSDDVASVETKSFTCAFCNRGFSNAQALGGHMNIHRRDRAKLKQQLSSDVTKNVDDGENSPPPDSSRLSDETSYSDKAESRSLPEAAPPPQSGGNQLGNLNKQVEGKKVEKLNKGELDLELRLGQSIADGSSTNV